MTLLKPFSRPKQKPQAKTVRLWGNNSSPVDQNFGSVSTTTSTSQTSTFTFAGGVTFSAEASVSGGVPVFEEKSLSVGIETSFSASEGSEATTAVDMTIDTPGIVIPPYSNLVARFEATLLKAEVWGENGNDHW